jgi:hypothetical protein
MKFKLVDEIYIFYSILFYSTVVCGLFLRGAGGRGAILSLLPVPDLQLYVQTNSLHDIG